jgi:hypothetical protein
LVYLLWKIQYRFLKKFNIEAECQWLLPVTLATWEAKQEDCGSRPTWTIVSKIPSPK